MIRMLMKIAWEMMLYVSARSRPASVVGMGNDARFSSIQIQEIAASMVSTPLSVRAKPTRRTSTCEDIKCTIV